MVFHGNTLRVNTHLILSWFNVQSRRLLVMSKPMCPATDTEASLRIQVIRKKQAAQGRFCINWTHESSENVLLKTRSKECVCKILRGRGGKQGRYYGWCAASYPGLFALSEWPEEAWNSRQAWQVTSAVTSHPKSPRTTGNEAGWCANIMVNSHTSQYSLVLGLSLANHKISNGSQRNYIPHPSIYKVSDVYLDITTIIKLKVRDPCKRVRMTEDILLIYVRLPCLQGCSLRLGFKRRATAVPNSIQKLWIHTSY